MNEKLKDTLNKILGQTSEDPIINTALKESLYRLAEYEEAVLNDLKQQISTDALELKNDWNKLWNIAVSMVPDSEVSNKGLQGFFRISSGNSLYKNYLSNEAEKDIKVGTEFVNQPFFLKCPYVEFKEICAKIYNGRIGKESFSYRLVPQYRFVEQENLLFKVAALYKINCPVIYSPYARRAVDVCILSDVKWNKEDTIDFCWEANGLINVILTGQQLMWNVKIDKGETESSNIAPNGQEIYYQYFYTDGIKQNVFVYPDYDQESILEAHKGEDKIQLISKKKFSLSSFKRITIVPQVMDANKNVFCNEFERRGLKASLTRLRTCGDIEYILHCFKTVNSSCSYLHMGPAISSELVIRRFEDEHRYWQDKDELYYKDMWNRPYCCVKFQGELLFLADYANYVLNYLEYFYPEFNWVGVG